MRESSANTDWDKLIFIVRFTSCDIYIYIYIYLGSDHFLSATTHICNITLMKTLMDGRCTYVPRDNSTRCCREQWILPQKALSVNFAEILIANERCTNNGWRTKWSDKNTVVRYNCLQTKIGSCGTIVCLFVVRSSWKVVWALKKVNDPTISVPGTCFRPHARTTFIGLELLVTV